MFPTPHARILSSPACGIGTPCITCIKNEDCIYSICCFQRKIMPPLCSWCNHYYASQRHMSTTSKRIHYNALCSRCNTLYRSNEYGYSRSLRLLPSRIVRKSFLDAPLYVPKISMHQQFLESEVTSKRVEQITHMYGKSTILRILKKIRAKPIEIYALLQEADIWLTASEATICLEPYKIYGECWKFQHAFGCRVVDTWNLTPDYHGVAACYYRLPSTFPTIAENIKLPDGIPYQHRDLL